MWEKQGQSDSEQEGLLVKPGTNSGWGGQLEGKQGKNWSSRSKHTTINDTPYPSE